MAAAAHSTMQRGTCITRLGAVPHSSLFKVRRLLSDGGLLDSQHFRL